MICSGGGSIEASREYSANFVSSDVVLLMCWWMSERQIYKSRFTLGDVEFAKFVVLFKSTIVICSCLYLLHDATPNRN